MVERADPRRGTGALGEQLAVEHLERLGFRVLARNVRTGSGEIDIVAHGGEELVFVEVKTRVSRAGKTRAAPAPEPLEGLRQGQRARLRRAALAWLAASAGDRPRARALRFDAIGVVLDAHCRLLRLEHVEGAW